MMVRDYKAALKFVNDYFQMDYKKFLSHYFSGERAVQIERNITPEKYHQLFDTLSPKQLEIINDNSAQYIVVTAGLGSGKTRVLVHKLAALLLLEDVKHEQLLMLTFSRAAAIEFKQRLRELIGNAAHFIEIKTIHSYCFDLIGNLQDSENIVRDAAELIQNDDVDLDMYNIAEIRYFVKKLETDNALPVISGKQWDKAVEQLKERYSKSEFLPDLLDILNTFKQTNTKIYRTDLLIFLHESKLEDFCKSEQGIITVSTMHKSKGREFDNVFMLLNNVRIDNDEAKRKIYVGITRAKKLLHIHYSGQQFDKYSEMSTCFENNYISYPNSDELILQLSHK